MIILNDPQGSEAWRQSRVGLPTASNFDSIITPKGNPSASALKYMGRLVAEWFLGYPLDGESTEYMERGKMLEPEAAAWYELVHDCQVQTVGLCLTDDRRAGASPDRFVGDDGLAEIKCPGIEQHMVNLIAGMAGQYRVQVQGQLWVTGRLWCDLVSYNPTLPSHVERIERDDEFIDALAGLVGEFCDQMHAMRAKYTDARAAYLAQQQEAADDAQAEIGAIHLGGARQSGEPLNYRETQAALRD